MTLSVGQAAGLGAIVLACLLAIAFLLGRESARPAAVGEGSPSVSPAGSPTVARAFPELPAGTLTTSDASPPPASIPSVSFPADRPGHVPAATPEPPVAPRSSSHASGEQEAVARYFAEAESIQAQAKTWSDPTALANTLLKRAMEGDTSGLDELLAGQRRAREGLAALAVPEPCRELHRRTLEALADADSMLETVRGAMAQGAVADLASLLSAGKGLESRAREVDALAAQIKRRYGLAP